MKSISNYLDFIRRKGKPLSEINPGSDEFALTVDDALQALRLLRDCETAVLGGDILSDDNGRLIYAYQLWGQGYHCLNWYCCGKYEHESRPEYLQRCYTLAEEGIVNAKKTAEQLRKSCYIVFVTE